MIDARALWKRLRLHARITDGTVLPALAAHVFYTVSKHGPWADEAQAGLLARDFPWLRLVFTELRFEGHPALWSVILSLAIHLLHLPYGYLGYLTGSVAIAGLAVLIFLAPFPRPLRYLIAGSFFFLYQYAIVARPYVLTPLLAVNYVLVHYSAGRRFFKNTPGPYSSYFIFEKIDFAMSMQNPADPR
jgi:hypothetical protein